MVLFRRLFLSLAGLFVFAGVSSAVPIADLQGDFTPVTFPTGWRYLRNTAVIGNSAAYTPLLWDAGNVRYDMSGSEYPSPALDYVFLDGSGNGHPGPGTIEGGPFNEYLIAAYTIQPGEAGTVSLVNGSVRSSDPGGANGMSNGWDILMFVGNTQVGAPLLVPWTLSPATFSRQLGALNVGDTVYFALGPNGDHLFDAAFLEFQLDSIPFATAIPEPATLLTLGSGLIAVIAVRRRKRA
jgi:hypothetical protein